MTAQAEKTCCEKAARIVSTNRQVHQVLNDHPNTARSPCHKQAQATKTAVENAWLQPQVEAVSRTHNDTKGRYRKRRVSEKEVSPGGRRRRTRRAAGRSRRWRGCRRCAGRSWWHRARRQSCRASPQTWRGTAARRGLGREAPDIGFRV